MNLTKATTILVLAWTLGLTTLTPAEDSQEWTIKVIAQESGLPVNAADITIYPGGKDRGAENKFEFKTDQHGVARIPAIEYEQTAPNDLANILITYRGERRAAIFSGPDLLKGEHERPFLVQLQPSRKVDDENKVWATLNVTDFRKKDKGEFWELRISGNVPGVNRAASEWWGYLSPQKEGKRTKLIGHIPKGLTNAVLHLDSRLGAAFLLEDYQSGQIHAGKKVHLGTIDGNFEGRISWYNGGSIEVRVAGPDGKILNDATVDAFFRSSIAPEYFAKFRPLRQGTEGKYVSPPMLSSSVAAIRVSHPNYAPFEVDSASVDSGERIQLAIQLKPYDADKDKNGEAAPPLFDFERILPQRERIVPGKSPDEGGLPQYQFGPIFRGLRMAWVMESKTMNFSAGDQVKNKFVIQNVSDLPIQFSTLTWIQDAQVTATDDSGAEIQTSGAMYTGMTPPAHFRLCPGEIIELKSASVGIGKGKFKHPVAYTIPAEPNKRYRMTATIKLPGVQISDGDGNVLVPAKGEWIGRLRSGEMEFTTQ